MPRRPRPPVIRRLRQLAGLLFGLALVLQPVMAAVGELHEVTAHAVLDHAHADDVHLDGAGDDHDAGSPVHALLHVAHCCTQASTAALPSMGCVLVPVVADALPTLARRAPPLAPRGDVFRPPISG